MQQARTTTLSTTPRSLPPFITSTSSHSVPQLPAPSSSPSLNSNSKLGSSTLPPFSNKSNGTGMPPLLSEGGDVLESEMSEQDLSFETDDGNSHHPTQDLEGRLAPSGLKSGSPPTLPVLVVRDVEEEERERKERVQKVMKRVYLAKLTRTFQNRVAFASFKIQRGWQDARIEVIEPHLEEVARKRKLEAQQDQQGHGQHLHHQEFRNQQPHLDQRQHQPIQYQQQVHDPQAMHSQQLPPHAQYNSQIPPPHQQQASLSHSHSSELQSIPMAYADSSSTSSLNAPRSAKRARGGSLADASMANTSMYDQYPSTHSSFPPLENYAGTFSPHVNGHHQPMASTSTLSNGSSINGLPLPRSNSLPKAQLYSSPMRPQSTNQESSARKKSTTDSNFNSFVNAATALTGLARNPSDDQLLMGTSTSEQIFNGGGGGGELPVPTSPSGLIHHPSHHQHQHQPRTPPPLHSSLKGKSSMMLENPTADAAELMLFLAASPSPAQNRVASSNNIGGEGLKGRRLFSTGDDYGKYLGAGAGGGGAGGGGGGGDYTSHPHPNTDATSNSIYDSIGQPPMTPSRERDRTTSFGGGDWGAYLNVSPSPTRGGTGGAGRGMGGGGGVGGGQAFADFPMGTTASNSNGGTVAW